MGAKGSVGAEVKSVQAVTPVDLSPRTKVVPMGETDELVQGEEKADLELPGKTGAPIKETRALQVSALACLWCGYCLLKGNGVAHIRLTTAEQVLLHTMQCGSGPKAHLSCGTMEEATVAAGEKNTWAVSLVKWVIRRREQWEWEKAPSHLTEEATG